jgi:hypothetical protein
MSTKALDMLRSKYMESQNEEWRRSASKFTHLAEHHYKEDVVRDRDAVAEYGGEHVGRITEAVNAFFSLPDLRWVIEAPAEDYVFVEDDQTSYDAFEFEGTKIYGSPDFALRDKKGHVHLYALYARIKWGVPLEEFSGYDVYLREGEVTPCMITPETMSAAEDEIRRSIAAMRELHFNADHGMGDREPFPQIPADSPEARACRRCRFRELCDR